MTNEIGLDTAVVACHDGDPVARHSAYIYQSIAILPNMDDTPIG